MIGKSIRPVVNSPWKGLYVEHKLVQSHQGREEIPCLIFLIFSKERTLKLKLMFIKSLIEEIVGISILLGRTTNPEVLTAFESMDKDHVKEYRDSLAEEFRILRPNVHLLLEEEGV